MAGQSCQKYKLERAYRETCMTIVTTEANISMFNSMIRRKLATNDVRNFAKKQAAQCRVYKQASHRLEKLAMKLKRMDAIASVKRLRSEKYKIKLSLMSSYSDKEKAKKVINNINYNASDYKRWLRESRRSKVDHIETKRQIEEQNRRSLESCPSVVRGMLKDLRVFNAVPSPEDPKGPMTCHPNIKLSEDELLILNRGPKFMVRKWKKG